MIRHLVQKHGPDAVSDEQPIGHRNCVDVVVRKGGAYWFYEIKPGMTPRAAIRAALGQLLEYAYWPDCNDEPERLIIVGERPANEEAEIFLPLLRERFGLPIYYQQFDEKAQVLRDPV